MDNVTTTTNVMAYFEKIEKEGDSENNSDLSCSFCEKAYPAGADNSELAAHLHAEHVDKYGVLLRKTQDPLNESRIWTYFAKLAAEDYTGQCLECGKHIRYLNSITRLRQHLSVHEEAYQKYLGGFINTDPQIIENIPVKMIRWYKKGKLTKYYEYDVKEDRAKCNACGAAYAIKSTVGYLKVHLRKSHPELYRELCLSEGDSTEEVDEELNIEKDPERILEQTIDLGEYFEKYEDEDKSLTCMLCKKSFNEEDDEETLVEHLFSEHPQQVEVQKSQGKRKPSDDVIWDFFEVVSLVKQLAKCKYCEERGSYASSSAELAIHLSRAHPLHFEEYMERRRDARKHPVFDAEEERLPLARLIERSLVSE